MMCLDRRQFIWNSRPYKITQKLILATSVLKRIYGCQMKKPNTHLIFQVKQIQRIIVNKQWDQTKFIVKNFHQKHNKFHQDLTSKILNSQFHSTKSNKQLESQQVRCYLRNDVKRIEKKLQSLSSGGHLRSLPQAALDGDKRDLDGSSELLDLVAELDERGPHSHDDSVDVDELGAEVDEVGVVAVDEVDELVVEGG